MSKYQTNDIEVLAGIFKALGNSQRLRIFLRLLESCQPIDCTDSDKACCCVGDLGEAAKLGASTISHHLKELRLSGLMKAERHGQKVLCRLDSQTLARLVAFLSEACMQFQSIAEHHENPPPQT